MTLLFPAGLWALLALPLLVLPYLLRERPHRRTVPALFLYQGIEPGSRLRLFGRPRFDPLFLLQALLILVVIAAIVRPALESDVSRAAIIVDNAATMQARDSSGRSRIDLGRAAVRERLAREPDSLWDVVALRPGVRIVATGAGAGEAARAVDGVEPVDLPHGDAGGAVAFLDGLAGRGYRKILVVTDRFAEREVAPFEVVRVGEPQPNRAIASFTIAPSPQGERAGVEVRNYDAARANVTIGIEDAETGKRLGGGPLGVSPGASATFSGTVAKAAAYRARLEPADGLAADDEAFAARAPERKRKVLLVSPLDLRGSGLVAPIASLGFELEAIAPTAYTTDLAAGRDLVIFHRTAPNDRPAVPAVFLLPPPVTYLPGYGETRTSPEIAVVDPTHPAVRYLKPGTLRPARAVSLRAGAEWTPLAVAHGALVVARASEPPAAVVGFDLLPFLGDRNRPASILLLDLVTWLARSAEPETATTGEPLVVPAEARAVVLPDGTRLAPPPSRVDTPDRGLYWIEIADRREPRARSLAITDSDLRARAQFPLPEPRAPVTPRLEKRTRPLWLYAAALALALLALETWRQRRRGPAPAAALALRAIVAALLVAALMDPARETPGEPRAGWILLDVSKSVLPATREDALERATKLAPAARLVRFAGRPVDDERADADDGATDLEAALARVVAGEEGPASVVLASDGWQTRGEARRVLASLRERGIRVETLPLTQPPPGNVGVVRLDLPARSEAGKAAVARVVVDSENASTAAGEIVLRRGASVVGRENVRLAPGESAVALPVLLAADGLAEFSATFRAADAATNRIAADDVAKAWVSVKGRPGILLVGSSESENRYLVRALQARGFRVDSRVGGGRLAGFEDHAALILNDIPRSDLAGGLPERIRDWVERGGSLVMTGGPRSFGLGGWRGTPVEEALPVRMKERERDEPRLAVALVIDKSGSMREERRMLYAREAARALAQKLDDDDRLTVIGFDREAFVVVPLSRVGDIRGDLESRLARLRPNGGTRLYPGLVAAERELLDEDVKRRHVIVLSDGLSEDADSAAGRRVYYDLALALSEQDITVSTIALGDSADADFLERLAGFGRGASHVTLDPSTLPDVVLGELGGPAGKEKTLKEEPVRPIPSPESPLVGEIARATREWPTVLGLVETIAKPRARVDVGTRARGEPPLIASWEFGSGRAVAFTTDAYGRWSDRWVRWDRWSPLWAAIATWLLPAGEEIGGDFAMAFAGDAIVVDAIFERELAGETLVAHAVGPDGKRKESPFQRVAPGLHRARLATTAPGDYRIEVRGARGPLTRPPLGFTIAAGAALERPRPEPNRALLDEIASATGGRAEPKAGEVPPVTGPAKREPLTHWLLIAALALFLIELIVRRARGAAVPARPLAKAA